MKAWNNKPYTAQQAEQDLLDNIEKKPLKSTHSQKNTRASQEHHKHQKRKTGEPFYLHPVTVANILLEYTQEQDPIVTTPLHHMT